MQFYYERFYPYCKRSKKTYKHKALIGLGGNVGNMQKRFKRVYRYLLDRADIHVSQTSPILKNPPFGYLEQNDFYNAVMLVETSLSPRELLKLLLHTEKIFKRKRSFKNAPRTLDLDIIFFDSKHYRDRHLTIPHPCWSQRESVVIPLAYISQSHKRIR